MGKDNTPATSADTSANNSVPASASKEKAPTYGPAEFAGLYGLDASQTRIVQKRHANQLKTEAEWYELLKPDFKLCRNLNS